MTNVFQISMLETNICVYKQKKKIKNTNLIPTVENRHFTHTKYLHIHPYLYAFNIINMHYAYYDIIFSSKATYVVSGYMQSTCLGNNLKL